MHFLFSGLTALLGSPEVQASTRLMTLAAGTDLGKTAVNTIKKIAEVQNHERR